MLGLFQQPVKGARGVLIDRRLVSHFDWRLAALAVGLALYGILTIYSGNAPSTSAFRRGLPMRQVGWLLLGLAALGGACLVHYRTVYRFAYPIFACCLLSLVAVLVSGRTGLGAQRWIRLGPLSFQPSEFVKLGLILFLARYFDDRRDELDRPRVFLGPAALTLLTTAMVLKQPDLGTAMLLALTGLFVMLLVGLRPRHLAPFAVAGLAAAPLLWVFLKEYQKRRIITFLNPDLDPLGAGYHVAQSKIAVGSGGILGKGWLAATQSQLNFLPLNHTDFIFAVQAEQWGFLGSLALLGAYALLVLKALHISRDAKDLFATLVAAGVGGMLLFQVTINVGMVTGLLPVVGVPLPLMSYGGSSLITTLLSLGLVLNIHMRRFVY
jgi:rod shape determining protein RodA